MIQYQATKYSFSVRLPTQSKLNHYSSTAKNVLTYIVRSTRICLIYRSAFYAAMWRAVCGAKTYAPKCHTQMRMCTCKYNIHHGGTLAPERGQYFHKCKSSNSWALLHHSTRMISQLLFRYKLIVWKHKCMQLRFNRSLTRQPYLDALNECDSRLLPNVSSLLRIISVQFLSRLVRLNVT